jgi:hypothetical protein
MTLRQKNPLPFDVNLRIVISFFGFDGLKLTQTFGPICQGPFIAEHSGGYQKI